MNKQKSKALIIGCIGLVIIIALFAVIYFGFVQKPTTGEKRITTEIIFADGESKTVEIQTDANYLREALEEEDLIEGKESDYGLFIMTVDNITADEAAQQWWCITKGGENVNTSVDDTPIEDGGHYELTLKTGY